jgi:hypothetical protein
MHCYFVDFHDGIDTGVHVHTNKQNLVPAQKSEAKEDAKKKKKERKKRDKEKRDSVRYQKKNHTIYYSALNIDIQLEKLTAS